MRCPARSETLDALVVASVIEAGGGVLLTGDTGDIEPLAAGHREVIVQGL